jgi:hypothetical protein
VTSDESDALASHDTGDDGDELPPRRYWWSLHRPETYALTAFAIALVSLMSFGATTLIQAILYALKSQDERTSLVTAAGVRLGLALLAVLAAAVAIDDEDEDSTWSPPVARAALLVAVLAALLAVAAIVVGLMTSVKSTGFTG